ncbi:MAG: L-asparaginase 1 [Planctomycetota bacterium]|nr:MAG: L-asparaginase 1 [Planctomycetota bacterium]
MSERKRVYIAYTGGTIGMRKVPGHGYRPVPGYLQGLMDAHPQFHSREVPEYFVNQYEPLLDSANMGPEDWLRIAEDIQTHYQDYDGFLVLHGTDTMAFTASALSFMLEGLQKPVFLTGSQIPLCETRNDAHKNLLTSLMMIERFSEQIAEVGLLFNDRLFRGNRATKLKASSFAAFESPNLPPLCRVGLDFHLDRNLLRKPKTEMGPGLTIRKIGAATVGTFRLFPGLQARFLESLLEPPLQGLVLECYGAGNAPSAQEDLMQVLRKATDRGVVVVAIAQPLFGSADLHLYATGRALLEAGVVSGFDMTAEAALAKLFYLFARGLKADEVKRQVQLDLCGELSPPQPSQNEWD